MHLLSLSYGRRGGSQFLFFGGFTNGKGNQSDQDGGGRAAGAAHGAVGLVRVAGGGVDRVHGAGLPHRVHGGGQGGRVVQRPRPGGHLAQVRHDRGGAGGGGSGHADLPGAGPPAAGDAALRVRGAGMPGGAGMVHRDGAGQHCGERRSHGGGGAQVAGEAAGHEQERGGQRRRQAGRGWA